MTHWYGKDGKTFGEVLGNKLLRIMAVSAQKAKIGRLSHRKEEALYEAFQQITGEGMGTYADQARHFLKRHQGAGTDKYLYTMGQLLDYLFEETGRQKAELWDKPLRLIYLTPEGREVIPKKSYQNRKKAWEDFYLAPAGRGSVSLADAGKYLMEKEDGLAQLLAEIIMEIYDEPHLISEMRW